ncbi:MAG: GTP 3',8-cyclase MoaA [Chloroflexi bacterium]|nr:GTP 3',8-cyclase MoaA [Chloroflexota bacterium]
MNITDTLGRPLTDLRISVTDRCNFRCTYCMPKKIFGHNHQFLPKDDLLTFEEIERVTRSMVGLGVQKVRLTGGEPLVRREIEKLIGMLAKIPGLKDIAMTTNGTFSLEKVQALKDAGLERITVSLDALDDAVFKALNDVDFPVQNVLDWIDACDQAGVAPIKINMMVKRGVNEDDILPMARYFRGKGHILRLIEFMDVGRTNGWRLDDVVSSAEIVEKINAELPLEVVKSSYRGEVANRYRYVDGSGEIGVIASVTQPFCGDCTRARLSANGQIYTCLFAVQGHDLRALLRDGGTQDELIEAISSVWRQRADRYSEIRSSQTADLPKIEMSYIGG